MKNKIKKMLLKVVAGRKLALYDQDENKKVTASYILQAPKLTVKSTNAKIQEGTFVGDIYVETPGFSLVRTTVEGEFRNKNKPENDIYRKLALYNQDSGKNVIETYVLTSPKMIVKSENFKIQEGTFVGDIYVEAPGFTLTNVTVEGNIYFAKEAYKETFKLEQDAKVIGSLLEAK